MTPLDDAYQHALWAKRAGICPRHVILAADGPMGQGKATWLQAVRFLAAAAQVQHRHLSDAPVPTSVINPALAWTGPAAPEGLHA